MKLKIFFIVFISFIQLELHASVVKDSISISIESYKLNEGYISSLTNKVNFYFDLGNYEKAIEIAEERQKVIEAVLGRSSYDFVLYQAELASFYSYINNYTKAIELTKESLKQLEKDNDSLIIIARTDMEYHLSVYYSLINDYDNSLVYAQKVLKTNKELYGDKNDNYISSLERVASCLSYLSRTEEALKIQQDILNYRKEHGDSIQYAVLLCDISESYANIGNYQDAIPLCLNGQRILERLLGEDNLQYRQSLMNLSVYYENTGQLEEALKKSFQLSEICKKYFGENSHEYVKALSYYAYLLYTSGDDCLKAVELEQKLLDIKSKINVDSIERIKSYANLAVYYNAMGYMDKAIYYDTQALLMFNQSPNTPLYRNILSNLANCYLQIGEYEKAREIIIKVLNSFEGNHDSISYNECFSSLAKYYSYIEDYRTSISILNKILSYYVNTKGENDKRCAPVLDDLSQNYKRIGQLRDALSTQEKSLKIKQLYYGDDSPQYASSLTSLGNLLFLAGEREKAILFHENAARIIKSRMGADNLHYLQVLRNLSNVNNYNVNRKIELLDEIKNVISKKFATPIYVSTLCELAQDFSKLGRINNVLEIEKYLEEDTTVIKYFNNNRLAYARYMDSFSSCLISLGKYEDAIKKEILAYDLYKKLYGNNVVKYDETIINLAICYTHLNDSIKLHSILKDTQIFEIFKNEISNNVQFLTSYYRNKYWKNFAYIYYDLIPYLAGLFHDNYYVGLAYDMSALYAKGLLLKTETNISDLIHKHGDMSLRLDYDAMISNRAKITELFDKSVTDSILNVINRQEDDIIQRLHYLGLLKEMQVSWKDVQKQLNTKDVAIEFISCNVDSVKQFNAALILKKDYDAPLFVPIARKDQIDKYVTNREMDSLYMATWNPLEEQLDGIENVYFSTSGELHRIPMEYLICNDGRYMCEKYNMYRISSTQELLSKKVKNKYKDAVLYGGLDYDMELSRLSIIVQRNDDLDNMSIDRRLRGAPSARNGFEPLINTQLEVSDVASILKESKINCKIYSRQEGVEETFKALSGMSVDILHISTHGMYINIENFEKIKTKDNLNFLDVDGLTTMSPEDFALSHSFLVMSGGNMLTKRLEIPKGIDDGILTAKEISHIDLFGADLVVLSACQTALGDIDNEGVYGLQRAFKKAGANTILMSLDKVDDEATRILMVEFYRNLMSGKTKHQSLKDAQKYLRGVDNGKYDDPKYWASFIMLDGLN